MAWVYFVGGPGQQHSHIIDSINRNLHIGPSPSFGLPCRPAGSKMHPDTVMPAGSARQFGTASARGGLSRGCMAQLVFVPFLMGILEVGATPRRPSSSSTAATAHAVPHPGLSLVAGSWRQFGTASARGGLGRGCMAQLVFVPFLMGIMEVGAAPRRPSSSSTAAGAHSVAFRAPSGLQCSKVAERPRGTNFTGRFTISIGLRKRAKGWTTSRACADSGQACWWGARPARCRNFIGTPTGACASPRTASKRAAAPASRTELRRRWRWPRPPLPLASSPARECSSLPPAPPLAVLRGTHGRHVSAMGSEYGGGTQRHMRSTLRLAAHGLEELVQHREGHQDDHGRGRPRGLLQLFDDAAAEATGAVAAAGPSPPLAVPGPSVAALDRRWCGRPRWHRRSQPRLRSRLLAPPTRALSPRSSQQQPCHRRGPTAWLPPRCSP